MFRFATLCLLAVLCAAPMSAQSEPVWQIGVPDGSCREFAGAGNYTGWQSFWPSGPIRIEGRANPTRVWPWIQPGPSDGWAGERTHPLSIVFNLATPEPSYLLRLAFVAAQAPSGVQYKVDLNGRSGQFFLKPGPGDRVLQQLRVQDPTVLEIPLPGRLMKKGENRLTLTAVGGSWVIFDCLSLSATDVTATPRLGDISARQTGLMLKRNGKLKELVDVEVANAGAMDPSVALQVGQTTVRGRGEGLGTGSVVLRLAIPAVEKPTRARIVAQAQGQTRGLALTLKPVRRWRIYIAPESHLDIGYTTHQSEIVKIHSRNLDQAIELCGKYPTFKWNLEGAWQLQNYLSTRKPAQIQRLMKLVKAGRINVEASHSNLLTGLLSDEELFRAFYWSAELSRKYGFPVRSATLTDVPSHIWGLPTVLANCGIRYLSMGINQDRAPILDYGHLNQRSPIWWEGPDGSRVLAMFHAGYAQGSRFNGSPDVMANQVASLIRDYDGRKDYPYDAIHMHGAVSDNQGLNPELGKAIDAWNRTYEYPKVMLTGNWEFFQYIEKKYGPQIPVVRGCGSSYWEDGAGSSAQETAENRVAHEKGVTAESLLACRMLAGERKANPTRRLWDFWNNTLLYDEHTWGAYNSISQPDVPFVRDQWTVKRSFADKAGLLAGDLLQQAVKGLPIPTQARVKPAGSTVLENQFYRVVLSRDTGTIASIYDKQFKRDLVDREAKWRMGQLVYAQGSNNRAIHPDLSQPVPPFRFTAPKCLSVTAKPDSLVAELDHPLFHSVKLIVSLPRSEKRVDVRLEFDKRLTYDKEAVYVAFPFQTKKPQITYSVGDAQVRAGKDWLPGACLDWFSIQNWLRVKDADGFGMLWSTPDTPLIQLEGINTGKWLKSLPIRNGHVYSYALNNYWHTNYKAGQDGLFSFRYSLTSGRDLANPTAYRFGQKVANPLFDLVSRYVKVSAPNVALQSVKMADDGDGYVVRLRELDGKRTKAKVSFIRLAKPIKQAWVCNGVEKRLRALPARGAALEAEVPANGITTLRFRG
ncbi:MAG TPA: polysaccharide lyase family protein [Armatimonadota bacterium]